MKPHHAMFQVSKKMYNGQKHTQTFIKANITFSIFCKLRPIALFSYHH